MRHLTIRVTFCLWAVFLLASISNALDIRVTFDDGNSLPEDFPNFDPDASLLGGMVEYAASVYEDLIEDDHVLDITYRWDRDVNEEGVRTGLHNLLDQSDGRETSARLRFDPDPIWFIDPTPMNDSEFNMAPVFFRDLSSTSPPSLSQQERRYRGNVPDLFETGYRGEARSTAPANARNGFDLLTIVFHEMGHALGMSGNLNSALDETADGDYDIDPAFVGGNVMAEIVRNVNDPEISSNDRAHLFGGGNQVDIGDVPGPAVMSFVGDGERRRPSAADIFAMSAPSNWTEIDLNRRYFLGGGIWNVAANWLGGRIPSGGDDVFLQHGDTVFLSDLGSADDLLIDDDSRLATGSKLLLIFGTATVGGTGPGELLVGGIFGPVSNATVDAQRLLLRSNGTLRLFGSQSPGEQAVVTGTELILDGGALIVNNDSAAHINSTIHAESATTLTVGSGAELVLNGNLVSAGDITKAGSGTLVIDGENEGWSGDLIVDNGRVNIAPGNSLGNSTTVNLRSALGIIDFAPGGHVQVFGGLEGDGSVLLGADDIWFGANNSDTVFTGPILPPLNGPRGGFVKLGTGTTTFADDGLALNVGRASSREGGTLVFSGNAFVSTALLEATIGSTVRIEGDAHVVAVASDFSGPGLLELFGGTFETSVFDGVLLNQGGTFSPGTPDDSTRVLSSSDNFNNDADSTLVIDVGGTTPGDHDQLRVPLGPPGTGKFVGLSGTVEINLVDGFVPNLGDSFTIAVARSISANWDALVAPIFNGNTFDLSVVNAGTNEMHAVLQVIEAPLVAGDYNNDGVVNAADFVNWRNNLGAPAGTLPNDSIGGKIGSAHYDLWHTHFGQSAGNGSTINDQAAVPEPASLAFIGAGLITFLVRRPDAGPCRRFPD